MAAPIKSDELFASFSRKQWASQYLFAGTEDFLIEQALHQCIAHWLPDDPSHLNQERLDAENCSVEDILQAARTVPFLGSIRVVQVDHTSTLTAADQRDLVEGLTTLSTDTKLVWIWGKEWRRDDATKPLVEFILERGQVAIFWPLFPEAAERWLIQRAKSYKKTLSPQCAAWLIQQSGESLRLLDQELLKCCSYVGERPEIELEDLQASFGYHKASSPFEWLTDLRQRNAERAVKILDVLLKEGEEPIRLLALLSKSVRDWLSAKGGNENAAMLGLRFHIKRGDENRFAQELNRWSEEDLVDMINACVHAEETVKTGKETSDMALTLLTLRFGRSELSFH